VGGWLVGARVGGWTSKIFIHTHIYIYIHPHDNTYISASRRIVPGGAAVLGGHLPESVEAELVGQAVVQRLGALSWIRGLVRGWCVCVCVCVRERESVSESVCVALLFN
jgi:hypothetical protein